MTRMLICDTTRRGINRSGFRFLTPAEQPIDFDQEAMKSIFGVNFIGTEAVQSVWGNIANIPPLAPELKQLVVNEPRERWQQYVLCFDPGVSPRQMYERFGQESVSEQMELLCDSLRLWEDTATPTWSLIPCLNSRFGRHDAFATTGQFRAILYAMQMLYLCTDKSLTGSYWLRSSSYHDEDDERGQVSLNHQKGLASATIMSD